MHRTKFLGLTPDGRYRYERWVREQPSQSNSGGWVPEEWTEDGPLPDVYSDPCPDCGTELVSQPSGGVKCPACPYWFCY